MGTDENKETKETKENWSKYSGLSKLPSGRTSDVIAPGCAVLEGGAFRGVYTSGVLDAFMEEDLNFECTVGVSAGALNGMNYVAGLIGRSGRINLSQRHNPRYVAGREAFRENAGVIGFEYVFHGYEEDHPEDPYDFDRLYSTPRRFVAVATNCNTGEAEYFEKGKCSDILQAVRASASMPFVSKNVIIDGQPYLDGGCRVKVAYAWAMEQGFGKIVVVRTRLKESRRKVGKASGGLTRMFYHKYPKFAETQATSSARANADCDEMDRLESEGRIFVIAPSKDLGVSRLEKDMEKLGELYWLGYEDTRRQLPALREYLARQ